MSVIEAAVAAIGPGPLREDAIARHVRPLFSRVLARGEVYLANHSLGRPLDQTARDVQEAMDLWYRDMDDAWGPWMAEIDAFCERTARLIGLHERDGRGRACVVPKPGAGQGLRAVLNALPGTPSVVATRGEFDSIDFILKTSVDRGRCSVRWVEPGAGGRFDADSIIAAMEGGADLLVVSQVFFSTGQVLEGLDRVIAAAHRCGALVLVDMYHAEGVLPGAMSELDADFAIGGSYKYTRGGPGAGWLAVHPRHLAAAMGGERRLVTLDTGWFAKEHVFGYERRERATEQLATGINAWMECTPPILTAYQARAGLEFTLAVGVERLRAYSLEQQEIVIHGARSRGVAVRDVSPRGAFVLLPHADATGMCRRLKEAGVNVDARTTPDDERCVRVCPDVLTTRAEIERGLDVIARLWRE